MGKTGVLFDLDGVLIDSERLYTVFWSEIDRDFPVGIPDFARYIKGSTLVKILQYYDSETVRDEIRRRLKKFEDTMSYTLFEGVSEFLDELTCRGIPKAVVTSSADVKMAKLFDALPGFRERFEAVITGSMVSRSKPAPEGYLMGARAIGCVPGDCYVFEDSLSGLEAGNRAGATVIGLSTTLPRESLAGHAHHLIDGFAGFTVDDMLLVSRL
ncbi:MAG: HAD family phosphatase [Pseudoflavonifractor sp.]|nr:HAD family phosphatase [Pseudoflavonifractor sp.]